MINPRLKAKQIYLIFSIALIFASCGRNKKVDVSNINMEVKVERFDRDFDAMRTKPMTAQAIYLQQKYGAFYLDFISRILVAGTTADTAYFKTLHEVFNGKAYIDLKHDVDAAYPNMDAQNASLTQAFKYIKYYYPQKRLPKVYAYFSGFQAQTSIGDGYFAVGLDLFLGADSRFYPALTNAFPHYMSRHFTPENIAPRVVEGIAREDMFPEDDNNKSMLEKMVYNGKIMYFMDRILPEVGDTTKIGYTAAQLKWCEDFKVKIWGYFLDENLLYETDYPKIQKYFTEAPFTPGLGEKNESAPKLAVWTGWQIVREYMDKHPEVTLPQLMAEKDAQKILNQSKYRPK
ncbi:gliding motility-associated lipoprotein GldB [Mucilaginibacter lappiensis]|uniref:Gliding motility-associated lipoprotein GldB n=1 Tax=Mucilaginibacter lappiensis TaxID=354630 RepID=A0ABR6PST9_9SPHI|nr:gliding motility lipoprotein GldB [Mucilaginibacter lappiensis]MBB6112214.1 gliding motility-associated lipoprotein GldB [Mucilaginibacter lappiensis]